MRTASRRMDDTGCRCGQGSNEVENVETESKALTDLRQFLRRYCDGEFEFELDDPAA
jgi:hypothetical protein